jgi:hypothetical protein
MIAGSADSSKSASMYNKVIVAGASAGSQQRSSSPTAHADPTTRNRSSASTRDARVCFQQQSTVATGPSIGQCSTVRQDGSVFGWSMEAASSRTRSALENSAREVAKVNTDPQAASTAAKRQPHLSGAEREEISPNLLLRTDTRGSRLGAAGALAISVPHIVDLDSSFDDEVTDLSEEDQRLRYFEAMDLSLERRFSDVVQLYTSDELDSDDDGDFHERLITPGAVDTPSAWLVRTPQGTTAKRHSALSPRPSDATEPFPSYPSIPSPRGHETPRMRVSANHKTSPQSLSFHAQHQLERGASISTTTPPPDPEACPTFHLQLTADIPDMVAHSARGSQGSPLLEAVPTNISGKRNQYTPTADQEEYTRAQVERRKNTASSKIPDKPTREPPLSPHGLGIVCIDSDPRKKGRPETGRPTLARSSTEPVLAYSQSHPRSTTDDRSENRYISRQPSPTAEAGANKNASSTSSHFDSPVDTIDISVYTSTTSLPPLPSSARRASIVLPPNAIKVMANPLKDREIVANGDNDGQITRQEASRGTLASHSSQYEYRQINSDSVASSPSRSRSQRTRRSALHPGHPYALQAEFFASTAPEGIVSSEPSHKQELMTDVKYDFASAKNKHWPPHLNVQLSDEPVRMPAPHSGPTKYSRPRLPPRHHTDTVLASSSYRRDSTVPPPAPKLPWHRMFDGPFLS